MRQQMMAVRAYTESPVEEPESSATANARVRSAASRSRRRRITSASIIRVPFLNHKDHNAWRSIPPTSGRYDYSQVHTDTSVGRRLIRLRANARQTPMMLNASRIQSANVKNALKYAPTRCIVGKDAVAALHLDTPRCVRVQPPRGRSRLREMMCRCTSLVPSQMRSIRASRQMRSSGRSLINPMPP